MVDQVKRRWWQARPRLSFQPAAGPAGFGVREPPVLADGCAQAVLSAGRLPAGCVDPCLCKGARNSLEQTPRVRGAAEKAGRPCTFRQGSSSRLPTATTQARSRPLPRNSNVRKRGRAAEPPREADFTFVLFSPLRRQASVCKRVSCPCLWRPAQYYIVWARSGRLNP